MAQTLKESALTTRNARAKLGQGLHWRGIDPEVHLGYRRGKRGGVWLVRWRVAVGYHRDRLGVADDEISEGTLDYAGAVRAARERVETARREDRAKAGGVVQTVQTSVEAYNALRDARDSARKGRPVRSDATHKMERHVIGREARGKRAAVGPTPLASIMLHELVESDLIAWRNGLAPDLRGATRQRVINDLKAALNATYLENRQKLPATLPGVIKTALSAAVGGTVDDPDPVARDNQILPDAVIGRVIAAAREVDDAKGLGGDLFRMIVVLAIGPRFSQAARLKVGDVQPDRSRVMMPPSRKGKGRKVEATPVPIGPDVLAALAPAMEGRDKCDVLLTRQRFEQVPGSIRWVEAGRGPWVTPSELTRHWAAIREIVELAEDVVPYSLRHSSIVRGIRAGLPLRLVAALHDTSVAMIERHYGRWIADGLDDLAARAVVPLVTA